MPKSTAQALQKDVLLFLLLSAAIAIVAISTLLFETTQTVTPENSVLGASADLETEKSAIVKLLGKYPDYRPGWIRLAEIESALGNNEASSEASLKAFFLYPSL